jgi:hypothetical protein
MNSIYFENLKGQLNVLRKTFLPRRFSPTGNYKQVTYEKARAYKVLTHAEIESYLETIFYNIAQYAYGKWDITKTVSKPLLALAVYYSGTYSPVPESKTGNYSSEDITEKIKMAFTDFSSKVKSKNHGIKEANLLQMGLPIGLELSQIDNDLIIGLNNYGAERGEIAHSTRTKRLITPEDAKNTLDELMIHLSVLDEILNTML